jgi:hypothetical protein
VVFDDDEETVDGHGFTEEPALRVANAASSEEAGLGFSFDALGDHLEMERMGHFNDVQDDLTGGAIGLDGVDEGPVDFECIERERLQAGERGVAGAEIVDGHAETPVAELSDELGRVIIYLAK